MSDSLEDPTDAQLQALLEACKVVANKMKEEGTWGEGHRVAEYVDSLLEHTAARHPNIMKKDAKYDAIRREMIAVVSQAMAIQERN